LAKLNDLDPQAWLADVLARITAKMPAVLTARLAKERDFRTSEWSACV